MSELICFRGIGDQKVGIIGQTKKNICCHSKKKIPRFFLLKNCNFSSKMEPENSVLFSRYFFQESQFFQKKNHNLIINYLTTPKVKHAFLKY